MPRSIQPPRLWLRPARFDAKATWLILDAGKQFATECAECEVDRAGQALSAYIAAKHKPQRAERALEEIDVADVLSIYVDDTVQNGRKFVARIKRLNAFWGGKMLAEVTGAACRDYATQRGTTGARRELEDLRAAINYHAKEGFHRGVVAVTLPPRSQPRDRWLTRSEAARLLWAAWTAREVQAHAKGPVATDKRPLRHLARFILIGLYTGTRAGAIATASPKREEGRSFVDLERGIFYRLAVGKRATAKRQTPAPIPPRLLAHLRRWVRLGVAREHFVEFNGRAVKSVKTAFASAVAKAGIEHASPHALRHTAATWMMQNGAQIWEAAGFLGMSEKMLRDTYGHHHPDFMSGAAAAVSGKRADVSLVVSLAERREAKRVAGLNH
jgi:integrase